MATVKSEFRIGLKDDTKQGVASVNRSLDDLKSKAASAGKVFGALGIGLGALGVGISGVGVAAAARQVVELGDNLRDLSFSTGRSVEQLSFLNFAAGQSGTSIEAISRAAIQLSKNLVDVASGGGKKAAQALRDLGLSADELSQQDLAAQIGSIGDALIKIENPNQRAAAGAALFGRQFKALAPLLLEGEEGVNRLVDRFIELNGVITRDQADKFDAFNDSIGELRLAAQSAGKAIATELAPPLTALLTSLATTLPKVGPALNDTSKSFDTFLTEAALKLERFNVKFEIFKAGLFNSDRFRAQASAAVDSVINLEEKLRVRRNAARKGREETDKSAARAAVLNQFDLPGLDVEDEGAEKNRAKARLDAERELAAEQRRRFTAYNAAVEETMREVEEEARQWEQLDNRRDALRKATQTDLEAGLERLAEAYELAGANSEEYGRTAVDVFNRLNPGIDETTEKTKELDKTFAELGATFSSAFEDAILSGSSFSDVLKGLAQDIGRLVLRNTVSDPLAKFVSNIFTKGTGGGGIGGFISGLFGNAQGGLYKVAGSGGGERPIAFTAQPGEMVAVGRNMSEGGGLIVNVIGAPSTPTVRQRSANGKRYLDLAFADAAQSATAAGLLSPLGVTPPMATR